MKSMPNTRRRSGVEKTLWFAAAALALIILPLGLRASESGGAPGPRDLDELSADFGNPPDSAKVAAWWHWIRGLADSKSDITADLEAMAAQGIGRVTLFEQLDRKAPANEEWMELFGHAAAEMNRLGMEFEKHDAQHYISSQGPWVTAEKMQKMLTWSRVFVEGPTQFSEQLSPPPPAFKPLSPKHQGFADYLEDVAVFAVRVADPRSVSGSMEAAAPERSSSLKDGAFPEEGERVVFDAKGEGAAFTLSFAEPYTASGLYLRFGAQNAGTCEVQVSPDGADYTTHASFEFGQTERFGNTGWQNEVWQFDAVSARHFRLVFRNGNAPNPPPFRLGEIELLQADEWPRALPPVARAPLKTGDHNMWKDIYERLFVKGAKDYTARHPNLPEGRKIVEVVDLTDRMAPDGTLNWEVPPGSWIVYRLGARPFIEVVFPSVDKLDPAGAELHFANYPKPMIERGRANGAAPDIHIDSWEHGGQNWSGILPEEFERRRGYDLTPYLPALVGEIVGDAERTDRFLWDFRRTVGDLLAENYYGRVLELTHEEGVRFSAEAGPANTFLNEPDLLMDLLMQYGRSDIPMGEFWTRNPRERPDSSDYLNVCIRSAVSAAHLYGKPVIQAESFTGERGYRASPARLKVSGDRALAMGINRIVIHEYSAQSAEHDAKPGSTFVWGTDWNRNITWWDLSHAWLDYLQRCQYLLQQGQPVVDVCVFMGENVPNFPGIELVDGFKDSIAPAYDLPSGYHQDWANGEALMKMAVDADGNIVLPHGMRYRLLVLPQTRAMTPAALRKIADLVRDGATVLGPKPVKSPSLANQPAADQEVEKLAAEVWGNCDGETVLENSHGKGRVLWGPTLAEALQQTVGAPDCAPLPGAGNQGKITFNHRRTDSADLYFVVNDKGEPYVGDVFFRAAGGQPQIWNPVDGSRMATALHAPTGEGTRVRLSLAPRESVFVVFPREGEAALRAERVRLDGKEIYPAAGSTVLAALGSPEGEADRLELAATQPGAYVVELADGRTLNLDNSAAPAAQPINGPWQVSFPPDLGAPPSVELDVPGSWTEHPDDGVKYFSGTATYRTSFEPDPALMQPDTRIELDLGEVGQIAEVTLNGKDLGIVWTAPWTVDVTDTLVAGTNRLEVEVTNSWFNRLRGDADLPPEERITEFVFDEDFFEQSYQKRVKNEPLLPSGLLAPVALRPASVATDLR